MASITNPKLTASEKAAPNRHIKHRLTSEGLVFILFAFAIGFAAYNTGNALLYLVLSMMLAFLVFSGIMAYQMLRKLEVRRARPGRIFAQTSSPMAVVLSNQKRFFSSYSLRLTDHLSTNELSGQGFLLQLPPRGEQRVDYPVLFPKRGLHHTGTLELATRYPFGFIERRLTLTISEPVLVYPAIKKIKPNAAALREWNGSRASNRTGGGTDLRVLREYRPGDPVRSIHWKASAKANRWITKEMEEEAERAYRYFIGNAVPNPLDRATNESFEQAVSFLSSLGVYHLKSGESLTLATWDGEITYAENPMEIDRFLRTMALLPLQQRFPGMTLPPAVRMAPQNYIQIGFAPEEQRFTPTFWARDMWLPQFVEGGDEDLQDKGFLDIRAEEVAGNKAPQHVSRAA